MAGTSSRSFASLLVLLLVLLVLVVCCVRPATYAAAPPCVQAGFSPRTPPRVSPGVEGGARRYRTPTGYPGTRATGAPDTALPIVGAGSALSQLDPSTGRTVVSGRGPACPGRVRFNAAVRVREIEAL